MLARRLLPDPVDSVLWEDAYPWPDAPHVRANFVASVDGAVSVGGRVGSLSTPADHDLFQWLRQTADAVVVGASTVRAEGYGPVRVPEEEQRAREAQGRRPVPPLVVVTRSLQLDFDGALFRAGEPRPIVATVDHADPERLARAREVAEVLLCGAEEVHLGGLVSHLYQHWGLRILTEGGPVLLAELWKAGMLDELCLTVAPMVTGGDGIRLLPPEFRGPQPVELVQVLEGGGDLFLRYEVG